MTMNTVLFVALAIFATAYTFPVPQDDLNKWTNNFLLGGQKLQQLSLGWKKDGTVAAGAKLWASDQVPVGAVVSSNLQNLNKIEYEIGTGMSDKANAAVLGDTDGNLKYLVNGIIPSSGGNIVASVLGDRTDVKTVSISSSNSVNTISASVDLDKFVPQTVSVDFGASSSRL